MNPARHRPPRHDGEVLRGHRLLFPHEAPGLLPVRSPDESFFGGPWLGQNVKLALAIGAYLRALNVGGSMAKVCARFYRLCNGPLGDERLSHKPSFGELARELGYLSPISEIIHAGLPPTEIRGRLAARFPREQPLFCKPVDGFQGRGASVQPDRESAVEFLGRQRVPYLAQSLEKPEEDWRYILHKDRPWLEGQDAGRTWRIAYKKVRPRVTGDGASTVESLVRTSADIPEGSRKTLLRKARRELLAQVPGAGEAVELVLTGNISRGAFGRLPDPEELARMDAFMIRFHRDLEASLGTEIATSCVDVGVMDAAALRGPFDWDRLRARIAFFEFQLPFGVTGYRAQMPVPEAGTGPWRWLPEGLWRWYRRRTTVLRFFCSVTNSGRARKRAASLSAPSGPETAGRSPAGHS